jgi:thiol-disulfide isomerase/thioredoxin
MTRMDQTRHATSRAARRAAPARVSAAMAPALFVLLLGAGCGGPPEGGAAGAAATGARPAAPVAWADLDRLRAAVAGRRGTPLLVNFWATWCVPCVEELPDLARVAAEQNGAVALLGVSFDGWVSGYGPETENNVRGFLAEAGVGYDNLIYRGDQDPVLEAFGLSGAIPHSILYDRDGRIARRWDGQVDLAALRAAIAAVRRGAQ